MIRKLVFKRRINDFCGHQVHSNDHIIGRVPAWVIQENKPNSDIIRIDQVANGDLFYFDAIVLKGGIEIVKQRTSCCFVEQLFDGDFVNKTRAKIVDGVVIKDENGVTELEDYQATVFAPIEMV